MNANRPEKEIVSLPKGWTTARLKDICPIIAGQSPPSRTYRLREEGLPFFQGKADFGKRSPAPRIWCIQPLKIARPGDILVSVRAPVGPTNVADRVCCIGRGLSAIRCGPRINQEFLFFWLKKVESILAGMGNGSTFPAISRTELEGLNIPLPPLAEQLRIAAILNERMEAIDRARAAAESQIKSAVALVKAHLRRIFSQDSKAFPVGWRIAALESVCSRIDYGFTASATNSPGVPRLLRITDIQDGIVNWNTVPGCSISKEDEEFYCLRDGDIMFARTGATTGKSYRLQNPPRSVFASYLIRIRAKPELVKPEFLGLYFQSDHYWRQIAAGVRGGAQAGFNASMLSKLLIPFPALREQEAIVAVLDSCLASIENLRKNLGKQLTEINALPQALLRQAFNGEL